MREAHSSRYGLNLRLSEMPEVTKNISETLFVNHEEVIKNA